jgi:zinc transport system substrate-binding protein
MDWTRYFPHFPVKFRSRIPKMKLSIKTLTSSLCLASLFLTAGCGDSASPDRTETKSERVVVVASNFPLHFFTERIGGNLVDARFLPPPDGDPAFWKPSPEAIATMQTADLVILNGATYENWVGKVSLSKRRTLDTSAAFADRLIVEEDDITHQHGPSGEHSHGTIAFTTWMDFSLASEQSDAVRTVLIDQLPEHAEGVQVSADSLAGDLTDLDRGFMAWGETLDGEPLLGSHPVYQYFSARYNLNLKSVHWEPDELPDAAAWRELESLLAEHPARWMIWEGDPLDETVQRLKELGVSSVVIDPCGNRPESGDFIEVMQANIGRAQGMLE